MIKKLCQELIKYGQIAGNKGYTPGISGNISACVDDKIIITSSGSANGYLSEEDFSIIDFDGNCVDGNPKPSSERFLHIEFYKKRPEIKSVFHFHSPYLTGFASAGKALDEKISPEIIYCYKEIPLAEYAIPVSKDLVDKTSILFKNYDIVLMQNHGVITGGKSVKGAYLNIELAEEYAKTVLFAKYLGGAKILPEDEVKKILLLRNS